MADFNIEALSLKELKQLQKDLAKAISTYEDRQKAEARLMLEAIAKDLEYALANLVGIEGKTSRVPAAPKYRDPENAFSHLVRPWTQTAVVCGSPQRRQNAGRYGDRLINRPALLATLPAINPSPWKPCVQSGWVCSATRKPAEWLARQSGPRS